MLTEYHCHILPGIDDGSDSVETSLQMVEMMHAQGVERICATPHFYAHREQSVAGFLKKRQDAYEKIQGQTLEKVGIVISPKGGDYQSELIHLIAD